MNREREKGGGRQQLITRGKFPDFKKDLVLQEKGLTELEQDLLVKDNYAFYDKMLES